MSTAPLPDPPWKRRRARRPAQKAPLSREAVIDAALEILDREGLAGISMRRIAERLDTGPASLYQHVADKEELLDELLDRVLGEVAFPSPDPDDWQTPLKQALRAIRRALAAHRDIAYVTLGRVPTGPNGLAGAERLLSIMRAGGVPGPIASYAIDMLSLFVGAVAYEEAIEQQRIGADEDAHLYHQQVGAYFATLPRERFPTLVSMVADLTRIGAIEDERFEFALDVQLRGIAALVAEHEAGRGIFHATSPSLADAAPGA
ncbi:TetR/AcrR family transcriptional regulator [Conexibacter sp. JD483]|uniref:TetR/AcrR family transcriptional regulator n=1 Tax=unclassified Conexibacter TaxID=2627773 RepID=UPI00271FF97E|nr:MULTISPECIES: TetR/AcrR family transcriptional regulator [unclassified Conexibacter]MDO8186110.1 TetR/AcrR family transcriptional regulator [Conexibacter sp. CPCC 205706]MDO8199600.1 TetR/AcrR family transcriptional regulator [Conexibacter sp. CPCC 205762]MDR9369146.1 TetR/AcrR family transcriptional regulator [Conexibacter sp. JD483]